MSKFLKSFVRDERGISAIEYALITGFALLALVGLGANYKTTITGLVSNMFAFAART